MSTIYDRLARRRKLCELGKPFTYAFYNFIPDFLTDESFFDIEKFKDKVLGLGEKDDMLEYIDKRYNKQTGSLVRKIIALNVEK